MRPVTFQCIKQCSGKQEVMIDTPVASLQRHNGTKEQKTNMKLMSKALSFCLWSWIGVISEEGPCPCPSFLSIPLPPHWGLAWGGLGQLTWGNVWSLSQGWTGLEVMAGLWPDEQGSCEAKGLFWHHDWAPWAEVPNPYYMHKGTAD